MKEEVYVSSLCILLL